MRAFDRAGHRALIHATFAFALFMGIATTAAAGPDIGEQAPDVLGVAVDGSPVSLAEYAGKPIVVTFWATWCPYCRKELPILEGIQRSAGTGSLQVIAVNTETGEVFRKAARALGNAVTLKLLHDAGRKASDAYGVHGTPTW